MGELYEEGQSVPRDLSKAVYWFRMSADRGLALAQNELGKLCEAGAGVPQDKSAALRWYFVAAEAGNSQALINLVRMYATYGIADRAYFWGLLALRSSPNLTALSEVVASARRHLAEKDVLRVEAEATEWIQAHSGHAQQGVDLAFNIH
jgi:TPR repeat protein